MSTRPETIEYILDTLGHEHFSARAMFGEYALYYDTITVALVCDDLLYVKIVEASKELGDICEQDTPYPKAKLHYVIEEEQLHTIENLADILHEISVSLPKKKPKKK